MFLLRVKMNLLTLAYLANEILHRSSELIITKHQDCSRQLPLLWRDTIDQGNIYERNLLLGGSITVGRFSSLSSWQEAGWQHTWCWSRLWEWERETLPSYTLPPTRHCPLIILISSNSATPSWLSILIYESREWAFLFKLSKVLKSTVHFSWSHQKTSI